MNLLRNALIGGILVTVFLLFIRWNEFQTKQIEARAPTPTPQQTAPVIDDIPTGSELPTVTTLQDDGDLPVPTEDIVSEEPAVKPVQQSASTELIHVKTDTLDVLINPLGGYIVGVSLPQHLADIDEPESAFLLLTNSNAHTYIAESDLVGANGTHTRNDQGQQVRALYSTKSNFYELSDGSDTLAVDLAFAQEDGTEITKRFTFNRDSYLIDIEYIVANKSPSPWKAAMYGRIKRDGYVPEAGGMFQLQPYLGAATTTDEDTFEKISFKDIREESVSFDKEGGWVAMVQHYFVSAWIPDQETKNRYKLYRSSDQRHYLLQFTTPQYTIAPGETGTINSSFYAGPKIISNLEDLSPGLDLTVDFGVLWFIAKPLFIAMDIIHGFVGNWGVAIVLLTFLVKLVFFYPSAISYRSMAKMRKLMPLMQELKERYGDDRQRMGTETMKLYQKEGVNPLGGCLPMLMQMPVFMALYWMIMESVELRHSPFLFWIQDLSVQDPFFILPILMGVVMFIQQKLNPPPQDPMQQKIFQFMPIGFTFILMFFPAALTLYMAVNTALSFLQQYLITKQIENS